jgi:UDP-N-acetylmuramate--alanine ligase
LKKVDLSGKPFHFIGIGGIGMSALAYVLAKRDLPVSGSDLRFSHITKRLQSVGAHIFNSQEAENLNFFQSSLAPNFSHHDLTSFHSLPQVICSTAINLNNSEYQAAQSKGCEIFHRSDLLAALIEDYQSIAVAGTHGKTTTSSLIGYVLYHAGLDPTIIIGGEVDAFDGNARLGKGQFLVAEADESDGSLQKHSPKIGVVTNIELDHPDHYQDLAEVIETFNIFASQCEMLVGCIDCDLVKDKLKPQVSYSLFPEKDADYTVKNVCYRADGTEAEVWERGVYLGDVKVNLLGSHNLSNALAAIAVGRLVNLDFDQIAAGIAQFEGAKRRFEHKGSCQGITFIDDYAHHPSEIQVTLKAARLRTLQPEYQRVIAIFQPHRYSRTLAFAEEFAVSFQDADVVIITDIYSAGEPDLGQITGQALADAIAQHHPQVFYHHSLTNLGDFLKTILQSGDLALFLGAGNLNQIIPVLIESYTPK